MFSIYFSLFIKQLMNNCYTSNQKITHSYCLLEMFFSGCLTQVSDSLLTISMSSLFFISPLSLSSFGKLDHTLWCWDRNLSFRGFWPLFILLWYIMIHCKTAKKIPHLLQLLQYKAPKTKTNKTMIRAIEAAPRNMWIIFLFMSSLPIPSSLSIGSLGWSMLCLTTARTSGSDKPGNEMI